MFSRALVRRPSASMSRGLTAHPELGPPDWRRALAQHDDYVEALRACGLEVEVLPADERFPDACFIEDVAVCMRGVAIVSRPGAPSRRGETEGIAEVLGRHFAQVERVQAPGTLEGGDVMRVGDRCYVGLSARTNRAGVEQLGAVLERHGGSVVPVAMPELLHLKTGLSWLEDDTLLVGGALLDHPTFRGWNRLEVPADEAYAVSSLRVNDRVLVPEGFPRTEAALRAAGFRTLAVDTSEFRKLDGGLSCLSLRW